ncbi:hypothetical protein Hanom_Chr02g00152971 [Helianthus anomalus]
MLRFLMIHMLHGFLEWIIKTVVTFTLPPAGYHPSTAGEIKSTCTFSFIRRGKEPTPRSASHPLSIFSFLVILLFLYTFRFKIRVFFETGLERTQGSPEGSSYLLQCRYCFDFDLLDPVFFNIRVGSSSLHLTNQGGFVASLSLSKEAKAPRWLQPSRFVAITEEFGLMLICEKDPYPPSYCLQESFITE